MTQLGTTSTNGSRKRTVWIASAAVLTVLLAVGFCYRHFLLSGLDLVAEATGSRKSAALCLVVVLLALLWLFVWLLLPLFVYFGLRDLRQRTAELDRTMKLCAQLLTRTTAEPPAPKIEEMPRQQGPGTEA